ncbi:hypothetical protein Nepgr_018340 [Nepenthes gracilis]|uniref:DUF4005 domain-containing protein n=1 Tax=Nepenthes gracilis TaxID=150966 RepID=A0AAD3XTX8_NEPGR|nr:hypothetical protein Nepgr_018340 [Nepenthes gracilis]
MGRSTTSCLNIIVCRSDSSDQDDIEASEAKTPGHKRGWSFRKRSARHRVLNNIVISDTPTSGSKEIPEAVSINFQTPANLTAPEKVTIEQQLDEKLQLPTSVESTIAKSVDTTQNGSDNGFILEEPSVIVIQTAVRGFLAQKEIIRLKSIVKLQAAIRGHLARRLAIETLYCIQAIVKVQALVRSRHSKVLSKEMSVAKPVTTQSAIEKLLRNGFARQLLETTPKPKTMNVKCDPSRPSSAWSWLERWMPVSSSEQNELQNRELNSVLEKRKQVKNTSCQIVAEVPCESPSDSAYSKSGVEEAIDDGKNFISFDAHTDAGADKKQRPPKKTDGSCEEVTSEEINTAENENIQLDSCSQSESSSLPDKPAVDCEYPKYPMKRLASKLLDVEGKEFVNESRKSSSPAFFASQSKFEELSSAVNSESVVKNKYPNMAEISAPRASRIHRGGSDCGTELSVTSTLDSPDRSEVEVADVYQDFKLMEERAFDNPNSIKSLDVEGNAIPGIPVSGLSSSFSVLQEEFHETKGYSADPVILNPPQVEQKSVESEFYEQTNGECDNSITDPDSTPMEQQSEENATNMQRELHSQTEQAHKSSQEISPKSHMTVQESQGTPSSQVSVDAKRKKIDKSGPNPKCSLLSAAKRSPSNPIHDSGASNSADRLLKDQNSGKRRYSFGSTKSDHVDQEPRDSSSSNSLPSYMQATESARAKAHSPRSSPDVQNKDFYIKKRHSLPGASGRQESPRVQRSTLQVSEAAKRNGTLERRWQR